MRKKISQAEARFLKKEVERLREEKRDWLRKVYTLRHPGAYLMGKIPFSDYCAGILTGATRMGAVVVGKWDEGSKTLDLFGVNKETV